MLRFNRTFMELKCNKLIILKKTIIRFNRTFMELKWSNRDALQHVRPGLIVPLWN